MTRPRSPSKPRSRRRACRLGLLLAAALACGGGTERDSPAASVAAEQAATEAVSAGESARLIAAYRLTTERVERWFLAQENVEALVASDPAIEARLQGARAWRGSDAALDDATARLEREPEVRAAIEAAGLTSRDFVMTALALHQALLAAGPGATPELRRLAARNVGFVAENGDVLRRYADQRPGYLAATDSADPDFGDSDRGGDISAYVDSLWAADSLARVARDSQPLPPPADSTPADTLPAVPAPEPLPAPVIPPALPPPPGAPER